MSKELLPAAADRLYHNRLEQLRFWDVGKENNKWVASLWETGTREFTSAQKRRINMLCRRVGWI